MSAWAWWHDLGSALRRLARAPGFALTAGLLLGLALAANACVFSVVYGVMYKPLPFARADRLLTITVHETAQNIDFGVSPPIFEDIARQPAPFKSVAGYWPTQLGLVDEAEGKTQLLQAMRAQPHLFELLGVRPAVGRALVDDDATSNFDGNVLVSWDFARTHFGTAEAAIGQKLQFKYLQPHPIVGVMPAGFHFVGDPQVWLPLKFSKDELDNTLWFDGLSAIGERDDSTDAGAAETLNRRFKDLPRIAESPLKSTLKVQVAPLRKLWVGERGPALGMMQLAAALLLLVTLANVCNLFLVRLSARQQETALLESFGANTWQRLRPIAAEAAAVCGAGLLVGLALYPFGLTLLRRFDLMPTDVPQPISLDPVVAGGGASLALVALAAMLFCATTLRNTNVHEALKQGGVRQTAGRGMQRLRRALIVAQIALTATLLVGTGLLLRSAQRLLNEDIGFDREHIAVARVFYEPDTIDAAQIDNDYGAILFALRERSAVLPGVSHAGLGARTPFDGDNITTNFAPPGSSDTAATHTAKFFANVGDDYFAALGLPLIAGRAFTADEMKHNDSGAVIVDDYFAQHYFPAGDALGQTFFLQSSAGAPIHTHRVHIVGVTATTKSNALDEAIDKPTIYEPGSRNDTIILHTRIDPAALTRSLQGLLRDISPKAQLDEVKTMSARIASTIGERTRLNLLLELVGAVALALASIGLYAVLAYAVRQRRGEFGIRMALGASSRRVLSDVLAQGLRLVVLGLACGLPVAWLLAQLLASRLYRISALDPPTLLVVTALIAAVGTIASWWPARSAARVDPMTALRAE